MADDVADSADLLAALGVDRFLTLGWSGGGPRALGCAALLPGCLAAASIAGVGPHDGEGLDWKAGMAEENLAEYTAAEAGREAYEAYLEEEFLPVMLADADDMGEAMGGLLPAADRAALDRPFLEWLTETFHRAGAQRVAGVLDDGQAAVRAVGVRPRADHRCPALVYQGRQDAMVPFAHGDVARRARARRRGAPDRRRRPPHADDHPAARDPRRAEGAGGALVLRWRMPRRRRPGGVEGEAADERQRLGRTRQVVHAGVLHSTELARRNRWW